MKSLRISGSGGVDLEQRAGRRGTKVRRRKVLDTLYYAVYRFGRSLRQPHFQAKACAGGIVPAFFLWTLLWLYVTVTFIWHPAALPSPRFKPAFIALVVGALIASYSFYGRRGRGECIISEYKRAENQRLYVWLGGVLSTITVSFPVLIWLSLRLLYYTGHAGPPK